MLQRWCYLLPAPFILPHLYPTPQYVGLTRMRQAGKQERNSARLAGTIRDAANELLRILLPKLFGNSQWIPNRGYEAAKRGQRSPDRLPLGAKEECSRHLLLFSKQFLRGCMKSGPRMVVRYSSRYEKALPNRSL